MSATILDFETAACERSIRASNSAIMRDVWSLPDCHERDLLLAVARRDYRELSRLNALPPEQQKVAFDDWKRSAQ